PLDRDAIISAASSHAHLVTVEENAIAGGAGSGINELLAAEGLAVDILNIGLDDNYIQHGTAKKLPARGPSTIGRRPQQLRQAGKQRTVPDSGLRQTGA
ncbi:transketolase C-terminal domain-containing protein, partial [Pseudomonadota bacterium]